MRGRDAREQLCVVGGTEVLEVVEVGEEALVIEHLCVGEVIEVERVCEALQELERSVGAEAISAGDTARAYLELDLEAGVTVLLLLLGRICHGWGGDGVVERRRREIWGSWRLAAGLARCGGDSGTFCLDSPGGID